MKILIIINNLGIGGAERLVVDDINEMLKRNIDIRLLTLKSEKEGRSLASQCNVSPKNWIKVDFGSLLNIKSWLLLIKEVRKIGPDVLITHLWYSNTVGRIVGKICGIKKITFEHNVYDTLKTKKMFLIDQILQRFSTHIVAVSQAVRSSLIAHGIDSNKIQVVTNGIDINKYDIQSSITHNKFTYLFIGRLIYQKAVDVLLEAFSRTDNSSLLLIGDGANRSEFEALANKLNLDNRVKFLGTRDDIPNLLASADCFILPSRYEGLPIVLLEALAAGKPIIVSDFPSAVEVITNEHNGLVVNREDIDGLANVMNRIQSNPELAKKLGTQAKKDSEKFSIKTHVDQLLSLTK